MSKKKNERMKKEIRFASTAGKKEYLDAKSSDVCDRMLENNQLFITQVILAVDFIKFIKRGEVTRLEKDLEIAIVSLHGCRKRKYTRLLLERCFDQRFL